MTRGATPQQLTRSAYEVDPQLIKLFSLAVVGLDVTYREKKELILNKVKKNKRTLPIEGNI